MPLDFPASPITGATYTAPNGTIWVWDGAKWANGVYIGTAYAPINAPTFTGDARAVTPAAGDADTSVATTAFVSAAVAPAFNGVGRNLIHNPLFNVAQRGAGPFVGVVGTWVYTVDRWKALPYAAGDSLSVARNAMGDADRAAIGDEAALYSFANSFTGGAGAGNACVVVQALEGVRRLSGKTVTVSFWAVGSTSLKFGLSFSQLFGTGGSPSAPVNSSGQAVTVTTAWVRYSLTFSIPSASGKTLGTAGDDCTLLNLWFSSGTTNAANSGSVGVQSGAISLWGVQLEVGSVATPLEKPDPQQDLAKCQRMFYPGFMSWYGYGAAGGTIGGTVTFPVAMRVAPTVAFISPGYNNASAIAFTAGSGVYGQVTATATVAGVSAFTSSFTASADL